MGAARGAFVAENRADNTFLVDREVFASEELLQR